MHVFGVVVFEHPKAYSDESCDKCDDRANQGKLDILRVYKLGIGSKNNISGKEKHDKSLHLWMQGFQLYNTRNENAGPLVFEKS